MEQKVIKTKIYSCKILRNKKKKPNTWIKETLRLGIYTKNSRMKDARRKKLLLRKLIFICSYFL